MALEFESVAAPAATPRTGKPGDVRLFRKRPGIGARMYFTEQLALLLETGMALHASLQLLRNQTTDPVFARVIDDLLAQVAEGRAFSSALARHPGVFPTTYVNLIAAAETGGFMDKVLLELLQMDERRAQLRTKMFSALSYPVFLIVFSIAVVIFVLVVVFPKFADLFTRIQDDLPVTTLVLMKTSDLLIEYWWLMLAGLGIAGIALASWLRSPRGRATVDRLKLRVFYLRDIFIQLYLLQSLRVMGLSLGNGVSVMDTLESCRDVVQNHVYRDFIKTVQARVQAGDGLAAAFNETEFIPQAVRQMVSTGEETGNLPRVMNRIADHYERELGKRLASFSRLVEPVLLLVMGVVVGLIVSSLILPIFQLSRAAG
ncbi:MAG: type II secretion system F family protein [Thiogranum sp.]